MDIKLEQSQKNILSPIMEQSIRILQMDWHELTEYLQEEMLSNPVIEIEFNDTNSCFEKSEIANIKPANHSSAQSQVSSGASSIEFAYTNDFIALEENLLLQIDEDLYTPKLMQIIKHLIRCIDENGYLKNFDDEVLSQISSPDDMEKAISVLQALEPAGIAGRNLSEVLLLQLKRTNKLNELRQALLTDYLPDLSKGKFAQVAKDLKQTPDKIKAEYELIKTLNPRPGLEFHNGDTPIYISPDVSVSKDNEGNLQVCLCAFSRPTINVNNYYSSLLKESVDPALKEYVNDKITKANWIVSCIESRNSTLLNVTKSIVRRQHDFFLKEPHLLEVLNMQEIADELAMHTSTISRAIKNKYLICCLGVFPLKHFFAKGVYDNDTGISTSSTTVKEQIKKLIETENKAKPLSDNAITQLLQEQGVSLSRRVVAKYRDEMAIPPSSDRKA